MQLGKERSGSVRALAFCAFLTIGFRHVQSEIRCTVLVREQPTNVEVNLLTDITAIGHYFW